MNQTPDTNAMPGANPAPAGPPPGSMGYETPPAGPTGYTPPPPPAPPKRGPNWVAIIVLIGIVAVIGGGFWLFRDRLTGSASELVAGDCFDRPTGSDVITDVQHQPCSAAHDAEVIVALTHPAASGAAYPSDSDMADYIRANCVPVFNTYTGRDYDAEPDIYVGYYMPTEDGWTNDGNRDVTCFAYREDGIKLVGSLKDGGGATAAPTP